MKDLDALWDDHGGVSKYHVIYFLAAALVIFASGQVSQVAIFFSAVPQFRCIVPSLDKSQSNLTEEEIRSCAIPYDDKTQKYDSCRMYEVNASDCLGNRTASNVVNCDAGYKYSTEYYTETTISEWNLVCDRRILDVIATSLFFVGFMLGSFLSGPIADWFGRKKGMLIFTGSFLLVGVGLAFCPYFELFVILRMIQGGASVGTFIVCFIYINEIAPAKYRTTFSTFTTFLNSIGHSLLPGFAYAIRDWRHLQMLCSTLPLIPLLIICFVPESPRWLLSADRLEEAKTAVSRCLNSNSAALTDLEWDVVVKSEQKKRSATGGEKRPSIFTLFQQPGMRFVSVVVIYTWFTVNLVFYGLTYNVGNLAGDPYVNSALNGIVEPIATVLLFSLPWLGKRWLLALVFLISGVSCILSTIFNEVANDDQGLITVGTAMAILGKFGASASFKVIFMLTSDLYPTVVRTTGIALGSMSARIGGIFTPFTLELQNEIPWLTQSVFGAFAVIACFASLLFPDLRNVPCLSTIEEAEKYYQEHISVPCFRKSRNDEKNHYDSHVYDNQAFDASTKL